MSSGNCPDGEAGSETIPPAFREGANTDGPRVVVVGGGVIGCAAARELAPDHDVLVLERDQIAGGATARAAGEVTMTPSYTDHPEIAAHANDFFRAYDGTRAFEYTETPSVELVTADREEAARARVDRLRDDGVNVAFLEAAAVEERWPRIDASEFVGAVRFTDTGHLDPYTLATTLRADGADHGARFETGVNVTDLVVEGRTSGAELRDSAAEGEPAKGDTDAEAETETETSVRGVETDHGTVAAEAVVVAAGWRTPQLLAPYLRVPVRPYRTQCLVLRPESSLGASFPMGWIPGEHVYFRREENGDLLIGGWSFAESDPAAASRDADEAFRDHVAALVPRFLGTEGALRVVDGWAGIDGATPDTRPIIDAPSDAPSGLVVASGFHGRGVMTAPVAGALVRAHVMDEDPPIPAAPFCLSRFDICSTDFEFRSISAGGE
jgi:glycine/D-amino acid oxidase-like deaminating enzyme